VLLNPLPYLHPEQLVRVYDDLEGSNTHDVGLSVPELWDLRDKSGVFQDVSALWSADANLTGGIIPNGSSCWQRARITSRCWVRGSNWAESTLRKMNSQVSSRECC